MVPADDALPPVQPLHELPHVVEFLRTDVAEYVHEVAIGYMCVPTLDHAGVPLLRAAERVDGIRLLVVSHGIIDIVLYRRPHAEMHV